MRKFLLLLALSSMCLLALETDTSENHHHTQDTPRTYTVHDQPSHPVVLSTIKTYQDQGLTQETGTLAPNTQLKVTKTSTNAKGELVWQVNQTTYVLADRARIQENQIRKKTKKSATYWTKKALTPVSDPLDPTPVTGSNLESYTPVTITALIQTNAGQYVQLADQKGYIPLQDLSESDNRIEKVAALLQEKYKDPNLSIYVKQLDTGNVAAINEDKKMYAASVSKLPALYYTQEKLNKGQLSLDQKVPYTMESIYYTGSFNSAGAGSLPKNPDNKSYRIDTILDKVAKESDNAGANLLGSYGADKYDAAFYKTIDAIVGERWDMAEREASAKMAGRMMEAIYRQNGGIIDRLSDTIYDDERISKDIPEKVAHKIGDADDFRHDVAIVYTSSPFILSIFTEHSDYQTITNIANDIYQILK